VAAALDEQKRGGGGGKRFKAWAKVEWEKKLCVLRTDRDGEFKSMEFAAYCVNQGVVRHHTAPYMRSRMAWWRGATRRWSA